VRDSKAETDHRDALLEAVFESRSWKIGFGVTRLFRRIIPSRAETAIERWRKRRK
jgi:hypothetical protein